MQHAATRVAAALGSAALLVFGLGAPGTAASAPPKAPGFDGKTIRLGIVSPLTGLLGTQGVANTAGNRMWFDHVNRDLGGIAGKYTVELVEADNRNDAPTSIQKYNELKDQVVLFTQFFSTPSIKAVLPFAKDDNLVLVPSSFDSDFVHSPNTLPVGAPYQIQAANAVDFWLRGAGKGKTFCSIILNDSFGAGGEKGVEFAAHIAGTKVSQVVKFERTDQDFTAQITQLKNAGCAGVWLGSPAGSETAKIVATAERLNFTAQWIAEFPGWDSALAKSPIAPYLRQHFWVAAEGVEWGDPHVPAMRTLLDMMHRYEPQQRPNYWVAVGYDQGRAATEVLEKAVAMGDLSRLGIERAMASIKELKFDGLVGNYQYGAPEHRNPPRATSLFAVNDAKPLGLQAMKTNFETPSGREFPL
jgi:ABC-type branched-subunit amino acid transport system substrate-binding protein